MDAVPAEPSSAFSTCRLSVSSPGTGPPVIWLGGEHDHATRGVLAATLAEAIALDESAVVIDLSGVRLVTAATLGVIVVATQLQAMRGRSLILRAAPPFVRRIFAFCGLSDLLDGDTGPHDFDVAPGATALSSWVEVPATDRADGPGSPPVVEPGGVGLAHHETSLCAQAPVSQVLSEGDGSSDREPDHGGR